MSRDAVGGAEQIAAAAEAGAVDAGWRSIVIAGAGSRVRGVLRSPAMGGGVSEDADIDDIARSAAWSQWQAAITDVLDHAPVNLLHMHGLDFHQYLPPPAVPVIATLHLPLSFYPPEIAELSARDVLLCCVSRSQRALGGPAFAGCPVVENGVPVPDAPPDVTKDDYVFALGRICPEKRFDDALRAAALAGVPLILAGTVYPYQAHREHFERDIKPQLDPDRRFVGPVTGRRKSALLSRARCVVVPSEVAETSSLVAMEALAHGTPVVARRVGALPEIIEPGVTGFLVDDVAEMAGAIDECRALDPVRCWEVARARFAEEHMITRYQALYAAALRGEARHVPVARPALAAKSRPL